MNLIRGCCRSSFATLAFVLVLSGGSALAQNFGSLSTTDLIATAERAMQRKDYTAAIPALEEIISRMGDLTDASAMQTAQSCRIELARIHYQMGNVSEGMPLIEAYLNNEPRPEERVAMRLLAQGFFEVQDWDKIIELADRLLRYKDLPKDELLSVNLLVGQAYFQKSEWVKCLDPLRYAEANSRDDHVKGICQIMISRALVEAERWSELYGWIPRVYRTDRKYDITLNLTLMKAGKARFEDGDYLNALMLYRMVLPRGILLEFSNKRIDAINQQKAAGVIEADDRDLDNELSNINEAVKVLKDLPPYEEEVTFRIGQIYAEVKRYWEAYVLFDKLYQDDPNNEIGEGAVLQSVMVLYEVKEYDRAEARILEYLDKKPDGMYTRTLLSMMMRDNLIRKNFQKVVALKKYVDGLPLSKDEADRMTQADMHYMLAFAYLQDGVYKSAAEQFGTILDQYPTSEQAAVSLYYRGMSSMLQADYANALTDFVSYQEKYPDGDLIADCLFRQGVCQFGLEQISQSEETFTHYIETYPDNAMLSEAYSLRGDIEAAKVASADDPLTLDRAQADYRKAIDTATTPLQASYPAFQAAKVYKLEFKWQSIIDLMNYYLDRWEDMADIAEAVYWIGQAQIELGQLQEEAIPAYIKAIMRFGNDPEKLGVDKIINELVTISSQYLSPEEQEGLAIQMKLKLTSVDEKQPVLRLRLQVLQAMLEGDDVTTALAAKLLNTVDDLSITTPGSLALMCDVAIDIGDQEQMNRLSQYFIAHFEESDLLWHAYHAKAAALMAKKDYWGVLAAVDEAQGLFGVEPFMAWAQLLKANTLYAMDKYEEAEEAYYMILGVSQWRGPVFGEATYGMGKCRMGRGDLEGAHTFFQRTYLLFKAYDNGDWAAKGYLAAADCLVKLGRNQDAIKTLKDMLSNDYTNTNPLAEQVREQLKNIGGI